MKKGVSLTFFAVLLLVASSFPVCAKHCDLPEMTCKLEAIANCHYSWTNTMTEIWDDDNPMSFEEKVERSLEASFAANACYINAINNAANMKTFDFTFVPGFNVPNDVLITFNNSYDPSAQITLTIFNGAEGEMRFGEGTISINGVAVATSVDINSTTEGVRKNISLAQGQNTIRITVPSSEVGFLRIFLDDEPWPLPQEFD